MTELGIVKRVEGELVWIAAGQDCASCELCGACTSSGGERRREEAPHGLSGGLRLFGSGRRQSDFPALNRRGVAVAPGDHVEYSVSPSKAVRAAFFVLVFPLLLFVLFFALAGWILPGASEGLRVLCGLGGLALGFGGNLLPRSRRDYPEIVRVVHSGGQPASA
jgi:hypothetical protein